MATTTEHRKQPESNGIERRYLTDGMEWRAAENGKGGTLRGYALRFGSVYDMGWFTEEVDRRALDNADMNDVRVLLNHDPNQILGRTAAGTAKVGVDASGLWYEVQLPESPNGENARVAVQRGDITQSSWGFSLRSSKDGNGDRWEKRDGKEHRVLTDIRTVYDASPVTFPANPDTSVAKRSLESFEAAKNNGFFNLLQTGGTSSTFGTGINVLTVDSASSALTYSSVKQQETKHSDTQLIEIELERALLERRMFQP